MAFWTEVTPITPANLNRAPQFIEDQTVSGTQTATFSSISQDYQHLLIVARPLHAGTTTQELRMRFNADAGANYKWARQAVNDSGVTSGAGQTAGTSFVLQHGNLTGQALHVWIPFYTGGAAIGVNFNYVANSSANGISIVHGGGRWSGSGPVTEVRFVAASDNHSSANFSLYGFSSPA